MCEKRARKLKKGSHITRLREARRLQRLQWLASPPSTSDESNSSPPCPSPVDKIAQNRVILELAWKTIGLMHKNRLIQQKIIALQKETSEFVASVMNNPENRKRYLEQIRLHNIAQAQAQAQGQAQAQAQAQAQSQSQSQSQNIADDKTLVVKVEPNE